MDDLNPYLELALEAADKASAFIRQESKKTLEVGYKSDTDLVTNVDLCSEKIIKELLKSKFPEHQILAEEGGAEQGKSEPLGHRSPGRDHEFCPWLPVLCRFDCTLSGKSSAGRGGESHHQQRGIHRHLRRRGFL